MAHVGQTMTMNDVILEALRRAHPGATITMRMDIETAVLHVHCIVQNVSEVALAEQTLGGVINGVYGRHGVPPYLKLDVKVTAREQGPENLDRLTEDQKAERRKALIAATWKDKP